MSSKKGLFISDSGEENVAFGKEFLASPEQFARSHGLNAGDLSCPDVAHQAFRRGEQFAHDVAASGVSPDAKSMEVLKGLAAKHFGGSYEVALVPFGLKFREKAKTQGEITASGTGTVTFLDTDADVDG